MKTSKAEKIISTTVSKSNILSFKLFYDDFILMKSYTNKSYTNIVNHNINILDLKNKKSTVLIKNLQLRDLYVVNKSCIITATVLKRNR